MEWVDFASVRNILSRAYSRRLAPSIWMHYLYVQQHGGHRRSVERLVPLVLSTFSRAFDCEIQAGYAAGNPFLFVPFHWCVRRHENRIKQIQKATLLAIIQWLCFCINAAWAYRSLSCGALWPYIFLRVLLLVIQAACTAAHGAPLHKWLVSIFPSGYVRSSFASSSWWYKGAIRPLRAADGICWATWCWSNSGSHKVLRRNDSGRDQATWRKTDKELTCNCVTCSADEFCFVWRNVCKPKGPSYYLVTSQQSSSSNTPAWHQDLARWICEVGQSKWRSSQS